MVEVQRGYTDPSRLDNKHIATPFPNKQGVVFEVEPLKQTFKPDELDCKFFATEDPSGEAVVLKVTNILKRPVYPHELDEKYFATSNPEGKGIVLKATRILDELKQPDGEPADITNWIIGEGFKIFVSCGEPGIGKSVAIRQLKLELESKGYRPHLLTFDDFLAQTIEELYEETGKRYEPLELTEEVWNNKFADIVVNKIKETQQRIDKFYEENPDEDYKDIILLDFVGLIEIYGREALERLVKIYGDKLGLMAMAPDAQIQQINGTLRHLVTLLAQSKPGQVENKMKEYPFNIYCLWMPPEPELDEEKGEILGQMEKKAASAVSIAYVAKRVSTKIEHDYNIIMNASALAGVLADAVHDGKLPDVTLSNLGFLGRRVAYLAFQIDQLGLPINNTRIVLNIYKENEPIVLVIDGKNL